jgi:RNA polymerase sigma-70 factor (ECF subfamily)
MSEPEATSAVTKLLNEWQQGNPASFEELSEKIYSELHRIAEKYLRQTPNGTLQPTALVNEAYIRLTGQNDTYQGRKHFFALAAQAMRQTLVDRARAHNSAKRGGGVHAETLDTARAGKPNTLEQFLVLDQALTRLTHENPRLGQIIELKYFGGLNGEEIAEMLEISASTVSREQRLAEAWLRRELAPTGSAE